MTTLVSTPPVAATATFPASADVEAIIRLALDEDIGRGDITTESTVPPGATASAEVLQKAPGVVCGLPVVEAVFEAIDRRVEVSREVEEGSYATDRRRVVARVHGPAEAILSGERTALNFLQRLSGVATASHTASRLVAGTRARVIDTRKTTPGLRVLEKYAVRVGGASNHRAGLDDGFLIKENHIRAAGGITPAVSAAMHRAAPGQVVEVEVTTLAELDEALRAGARLILLDNFSVDLLRQAVSQTRGRARLEASGGITLDNLAEVARTGVDFVSLGALTHSAGVLDFSLEVLV
ncbi:MAG: carboxylating nicotinate-nucleotide diphosphorylase [Chloroflexi bacterium]|nr:carboxylating nicotinate-nucleotide diphosphorylase [Chloroflexota bacterium]